MNRNRYMDTCFRMLVLLIVFFPVLIVIPITGCSLDYSELEMADELREDIPDHTLYRFSNTFVEHGRPVYSISAGKAETYSKRDVVYLWNITFIEYDRNEEIVTRGKAAEGTLFMDTENAELKGDISFISNRQETEITAQYLFWTKEDRKLHGKEDDEVTIVRADGSYITGKGFSGYTGSLTFSFTNSVRGKYESTE